MSLTTFSIFHFTCNSILQALMHIVSFGLKAFSESRASIRAIDGLNNWLSLRKVMR